MKELRNMGVDDLMYFAESAMLSVEISQLRERGPTPGHGSDGAFTGAIIFQLNEYLKILGRI